MVEFYEYGGDGNLLRAKSDLDDLMNTAVLKLQYEATDISEIGDVIKSVVAEASR